MSIARYCYFRVSRKVLMLTSFTCLNQRLDARRTLSQPLPMPDLSKFIADKRRAYDVAVAKHAFLGTNPKLRMRLRVRLGSKFASDETELKMTFRGRKVTVRSREKGNPLCESEWVVFLASRFSTAEEAATFGLSLQTSLAVAGALTGLSVDVGADNQATTQMSDIVKEAVAKAGQFMIDDVHGVDVYPSTVNTIVVFGGATVTTSHDPQRLFRAAEAVGRRVTMIDDRIQSAALLMNAASLSQHPAAVVVLGIAAVELLAAGEKWNVAQRTWLKSLLGHLAASEGLSDVEKEELRNAVNGTLNFGALEKSRRLIRSVGLVDLLPRWETLYRERSRLFHGAEYVPSPRIANMSSEAREICKAITDAYILKRTRVVLT